MSGSLVLNLDKYELTVNDNEVELTFKEYELLKLLLENPDKVYSRNKLLSIVWGYDFYGGSRTVDVHMRRLRSKLELPYSDMLKTVRNVGYMFSPDLKHE
jgi:DNA-binding response OmpR family regulator